MKRKPGSGQNSCRTNKPGKTGRQRFTRRMSRRGDQKRREKGKKTLSEVRHCLFPTGATPNSAKPPKVLCSPSLAAYDRLFATYAMRNVVFQSSQVCLSSRSFDHFWVSVSYSPDCKSHFNATARKYSSLMTSFARFDLRCAASIAFMN